VIALPVSKPPLPTDQDSSTYHTQPDATMNNRRPPLKFYEERDIPHGPCDFSLRGSPDAARSNIRVLTTSSANDADRVPDNLGAEVTKADLSEKPTAPRYTSEAKAQTVG
jgi:hypothetical protein